MACTGCGRRGAASGASRGWRECSLADDSSHAACTSANSEETEALLLFRNHRKGSRGETDGVIVGPTSYPCSYHTRRAMHIS